MQTIRYNAGVDGTAGVLLPTHELQQQTYKRCIRNTVSISLSRSIEYGNTTNRFYLLHAGNKYGGGVDGLLARAVKKRGRGQCRQYSADCISTSRARKHL